MYEYDKNCDLTRWRSLFPIRPVTVREKRKGEGGVKTRDQLREEKKKALLAAQKRQEDRRRIMNGMAPIVSEGLRVKENSKLN